MSQDGGVRTSLANQPAFPSTDKGDYHRVYGMTYRQWLAGTILAAECNGGVNCNEESRKLAARLAVYQADELIAELEKK